MKWLGLLLGVGLSACSNEITFPMPMTAAELSGYGSGPALVAYLGQPDASARVCDQHAQGPHIRLPDATLREAFIHGLTSGSDRSWRLA